MYKFIYLFGLLFTILPNGSNAQLKANSIKAGQAKAVAKKSIQVDIGNPSLKNISLEQQIDAVKSIAKYAASEAMRDFFRMYNRNIKSAIFPEAVILKAGSFGYMFIEPEASSNMNMKNWIQTINYNLDKPLQQLIGQLQITKPNKTLQGGVNGITKYIFTTNNIQLQSIIKTAVDLSFADIAHNTSTKSFFPMVMSYDFGDLDKDARPYFCNFIYKQLQARFEIEELLLRDNPPVANNENVMRIFAPIE